MLGTHLSPPGGGGAPGQVSWTCDQTHRESVQWELEGCSQPQEGDGSGPSCAACLPEWPCSPFSSWWPCKEDSAGRRRDLRGSGLLDMHKAGWGLLPGDSHSQAGNRAASSSRAGRRAPRGPGLLRAESWLQCELMLLRRSQWVPPGPFRRLQFAFKPIHPGVGREAAH